MENLSKMLEYQYGEVRIRSRDPLRGVLELVTAADEAVDLFLDKITAEMLISVLVDFLGKGEGEDSMTLKVSPLQ